MREVLLWRGHEERAHAGGVQGHEGYGGAGLGEGHKGCQRGGSPLCFYVESVEGYQGGGSLARGGREGYRQYRGGTWPEVREKDVRCVWGGHKGYQNQGVSDLAWGRRT